MTSITLQRSNLTKAISGHRGGDGPPMLLIHGVGLRAEAWNRMLPALKRTFSVTVVDLPGHGESQPFEITRPQLADYTNRLADVISPLDAPAFVIGHSLGALIAIDLAGKFPERVLAIGPLNSIFRRSEAATRAVVQRAQEIRKHERPTPDSTLQRWFGAAPKGSQKVACDECRDWLTSVDHVGYSQAYSVFANENGPADATLVDIRCPAIFVTGSEERNSTPAMSRSLAARVAQGHAAIVDGARHMMPMTHADEVCELLTRFYDGVKNW